MVLENLFNGDKFGVSRALGEGGCRQDGYRNEKNCRFEGSTYIQGLVGIVHPSADNFTVVHKDASDRGFIGLESQLCLYIEYRRLVEWKIQREKKNDGLEVRKIEQTHTIP